MIALICGEEIELLTVSLISELFAVEIFGLFSSAPPTHAAVAVGSVGVGTTVDR